MHGRVFTVRFADDLVIGFTHRKDAERVYRVIFQRFEKYGLKLHPEKTRLVPFGRPEKGAWTGTCRTNRARSTFWGLPITGANPGRATG